MDECWVSLEPLMWFVGDAFSGMLFDSFAGWRDIAHLTLINAYDWRIISVTYFVFWGVLGIILQRYGYVA